MSPVFLLQLVFEERFSAVLAELAAVSEQVAAAVRAAEEDHVEDDICGKDAASGPKDSHVVEYGTSYYGDDEAYAKHEQVYAFDGLELHGATSRRACCEGRL